MKNLIIIPFLFISQLSFAQMSWKSLGDIPKTWLMLERDSAGYLVYTPCNGGPQMISIDSGYVKIFWQLDPPRKLFINKFTRLKGNKSFYIDAADQNGRVEFTAVIKSEKQKLVLWKFGNTKWVMTPLEFEKSFRQVDNPCPNGMKPEKEFLPVEFK